MRKIYFHGDNTYTVGEESYHLDGKNHNIQCIDGKWIADGKSMTFAEMIKMGVAVKMTPEETQKNLDDVLQKLGDVRQKMKDNNTVVVNCTGVYSFLKSILRMLFRH